MDGTTIYDGFYVGAVGGDPEDFVRPRGTWTSGPGGGSVTVTFTLKGSGTGLSGFSWDDFVAEKLIAFSKGYPSFLRAACEAYAAAGKLNNLV